MKETGKYRKSMKSSDSLIYSENRVIHNNQIKNPEEIIIGERYYQVHLNGFEEQIFHEVKIVSVDNERGIYKAKHCCDFLKGYEICELEHSLADFGIIPYDWLGSFYHNKWNTRNWLVKANK